MFDVEIRPATVGDAVGIAHVHVQAWHETYTGLLSQAELDGRTVPRLTERWLNILAPERVHTTTHVAVVAGTIVGFANQGRPRDAVAVFAEAELFALYLLAAWHGRGIGRALMQAACNSARAIGAQSIGLWVLVGNACGRHFYDACGGVAVTERVDLSEPEPFPEIGYRIAL